MSPEPSSLLSRKKILHKCLGERAWGRERGAKASSTLRCYHSPPTCSEERQSDRKPYGQVQEAVKRWRNAIPEENPAFPMLSHPSMLFSASWQLHGLYQSYACTMSGPIDSKGIFYMSLGMYSGTFMAIFLQDKRLIAFKCP